MGLLDEAETARFATHQEECESCREAWQAFFENLPEPDPDIGHIPPELLTRWDRAAPRLRRAVRELVRTHLDSCEACRQDLEFLGFDPALLADGAEESSPRAAESLAKKPGLRVSRLREGEHEGLGLRIRNWVAGGLVGGAVAVAATLLVVSGLVRPPAHEPRPTTRRSGGIAASELSLTLLPEPGRLSAPTRAGGKSEIELAIVEGARSVPILLPELYLPSTAPIQVRLLGPDSVQVVSAAATYGQIRPPHSLLISNSSTPLAVGRYRLEVISSPNLASGATRSDTLHLGFRLVRK